MDYCNTDSKSALKIIHYDNKHSYLMDILMQYT